LYVCALMKIHFLSYAQVCLNLEEYNLMTQSL
jgi:hypothetical protein